MTGEALRIYADRAEHLRAGYDAMRTEDVLAPVLDLLPPPPARCLDVGPGSGRDLDWLARRGHEVLAAEPTAAFRASIGQRVPGIEIRDAKLPDLGGINGRFDLILANLVLHHLSPAARDVALVRLVALLAPGGRLVLCLRHGAEILEAEVFATDAEAEIARAEAAGLTFLSRAPASPRGPVGQDVTATWLVLEAPR